MRWNASDSSNRIHLAIEGSCGGTTIGLQMAANEIIKGSRVLWVGLEMPNPTRFQQLFAHISPVASSKFHAMMMSGTLDKAVDALISAANNLPSVSLIILDDWCENSGKISQKYLTEIKRCSDNVSKQIKIILISKGTVDASGKRTGEIFARSENYFLKNGFEIWTLSKSKDGHYRNLVIGEVENKLKIVDEGVELVS
ncbi:MAG: hypothetical protein ACJ0CN_01555 [Candidatus Poseidoniaceae archaeon]